MVGFLKSVRCLAESNRSIRFCRPSHNRFVKAPCCFADAKVTLSFYLAKFLAYFFIIASHFYRFYRHFSFALCSQGASRALRTGFLGLSHHPVDAVSRVSDSQCQQYEDNERLHYFFTFLLFYFYLMKRQKSCGREIFAMSLALAKSGAMSSGLKPAVPHPTRVTRK